MMSEDMSALFAAVMPSIDSVPDPSPELLARAAAARRAAAALGQCNEDRRHQALASMADALEAHADDIVDANREDLAQAQVNNLVPALIARLQLDKGKLAGTVIGIKRLATLPDPLGRRQLHRELDHGLILERVTVPLGVLGVIFEARPDAAIQIAALAIQSGNAAILKGGREATCTNTAIVTALQQGLSQAGFAIDALTLLTTRSESLALLRLDGLVDLIIPRGSSDLVRFIQDNTRIPVLGHADGICHLYVDAVANIDYALRIALDAKIQYPAACNAIETLLIHQDIAALFLKRAIPLFHEAGVRLLGDDNSCRLGISEVAAAEDWRREYLNLTLAVRIVSDIDSAIDHIHRYGSRHTEAIVTSDKAAARHFLCAVDSAGVFVNCSTRFADGFRYGFGAEVGISTQTLPPRGPVGLEGLVTYRYLLRGDGHTVSDYAEGHRQFRHRDLPL